MRTIPALFVAGLCALALSGSAWAADRQGRIDESSPSWLEARTAFAAQDLWPNKRPKPTLAQQKSEIGKISAVHSLHAPDNPVGSSLRQAVDVMRHWGAIAEKVLQKHRVASIVRD